MQESMKSAEDIPAKEEEKPKRRRRTKAEIQADKLKAQGFSVNTNPEVDILIDKIERNEYEQTTIFDFMDENKASDDSERPAKIKTSSKDYEEIKEGSIVTNIYNNKEYKVVKQSACNIIEVYDKDHGYLTMARTDVETKI